MRRSLFFIFTLLSTCTIGQQDPLTTMFWNNYAHFNPATSGLNWGHELNVSYRDQWTGVNGAPSTLFANYNTIINNKHGLGINYMFDKIGFSKAHIGNVNYNYQFLMEGDQKLSIGVAAGMHNVEMNGVWVPPTGEDDPTIPSGSATSFNANAGIAYKSKRIFTGIGVTHLTAQRISYYYKSERHYYAHFGYLLPLTRRSGLQFIGIGRSDLSFSSFDVGLRYTYKSKLWLGLHYRTRDAIGISAQWDFKKKFNKFRLGYSYDFSINKLSNISEGSHEIMLGWRVF